MEGSKRVIGNVNLTATGISFSIILQAKYSTLRMHSRGEILVVL